MHLPHRGLEGGVLVKLFWQYLQFLSPGPGLKITMIVTIMVLNSKVDCHSY